MCQNLKMFCYYSSVMLLFNFKTFKTSEIFKVEKFEKKNFGCGSENTSSSSLKQEEREDLSATHSIEKGLG